MFDGTTFFMNSSFGVELIETIGFRLSRVKSQYMNTLETWNKPGAILNLIKTSTPLSAIIDFSFYSHWHRKYEFISRTKC